MASQDMPNVSSQYGPITMDGQAHLQHGNPAQRIVVYDQIEDSMGVKRCRPVLHLFTAPEVSLAERPAGASLNLYEDYPEHHVHDGRISNLRDFLGDVVPLYGSRYGWWSKNIGVFEFIPVEHEASQQIVDTNQNSAMDPNSASSAASGPIDLTTMSRAELLQWNPWVNEQYQRYQQNAVQPAAPAPAPAPATSVLNLDPQHFIPIPSSSLPPSPRLQDPTMNIANLIHPSRVSTPPLPPSPVMNVETPFEAPYFHPPTRTPVSAYVDSLTLDELEAKARALRAFIDAAQARIWSILSAQSSQHVPAPPQSPSEASATVVGDDYDVAPDYRPSSRFSGFNYQY